MLNIETYPSTGLSSSVLSIFHHIILRRPLCSTTCTNSHFCVLCTLNKQDKIVKKWALGVLLGVAYCFQSDCCQGEKLCYVAAGCGFLFTVQIQGSSQKKFLQPGCIRGLDDQVGPLTIRRPLARPNSRVGSLIVLRVNSSNSEPVTLSA